MRNPCCWASTAPAGCASTSSTAASRRSPGPADVRDSGCSCVRFQEPFGRRCWVPLPSRIGGWWRSPSTNSGCFIVGEVMRSPRLPLRVFSTPATSLQPGSRDHPDIRRRNDPRALGEYADVCGFEWPDEFSLAPADAIDRLRKRALTLSRKGGPPNMAAMELWSRLLGYNQLDCRATRHVVLHALRDGHRQRRSGRGSPR